MPAFDPTKVSLTKTSKDSDSEGPSSYTTTTSALWYKPDEGESYKFFQVYTFVNEGGWSKPSGEEHSSTLNAGAQLVVKKWDVNTEAEEPAETYDVEQKWKEHHAA